MGLIFELLAAFARDYDESAGDFRQGCKIAPEFLELCDREHVFLTVAPALFYILERDVSRHFGGEMADGCGDLFLIAGEHIVARESECAEESVHVDPRRHRVVIGQVEFHFLPRHRESFNETRTSVHACKSAAAVVEPPGNDFETERRAAF